MAVSGKSLFVVLVAVTSLCSARSASLKDVPNQRADLIQGNENPSDLLLFRTYVKTTGSHGQVTQEDVYFIDPFVTITRITAMEQGTSQGGLAYVVTGGIGKSDAVIRLASLVDGGYHYLISIYGVRN